jgi:ATP-dependent DNA ligase
MTAIGSRSTFRDGRVRLYTIDGNNWTDRYPRIVEEATRINGSAVLDAEVVCAGKTECRISRTCIAGSLIIWQPRVHLIC